MNSLSTGKVLKDMASVTVPPWQTRFPLDSSATSFIPRF